MIDWTKSMQQTYEFYKVDPNTWCDDEKLTEIESCNIERDDSSITLGSASMKCKNMIDECYVRVYLIAIQNGFRKEVPLGTFLVQTPSDEFDGKKHNIELDAYTPLIELKGDSPPVGYTLLKGQKILDSAANICKENMRAPVISSKSNELLTEHFIANLDNDWITFVSDLLAKAKHKLALDEMGRVLFAPDQDIASLQHVATFDDDNSSILYPSIKDERDLYDIPNVVEVIYSTNLGYMTSRIVNDDPDSPVSTINRGRIVLHRETNPSFNGIPTQEYIDKYAEQLLRDLSCLEHRITYTHGYYPVRIGDCVMLNYKRAGIENIKAKVISQSIDCITGCKVEETAVYTTRLWR